MLKSKDIMTILNNHLVKHFDEGVFCDDSYKLIKNNKFSITYKGNHGFLSAKFRGFKCKNVLHDGFLVNIMELIPVGIAFYEQLPFYDEMIDIQSKINVYSHATTNRLHLAKVFIYFPLHTNDLHYLLVFDTGDNLILISDIPEMHVNPVILSQNKTIEDMYQFLHVNNDFHVKLDELFFENHKKHIPNLTRDEFLVAIMETI